MSHDIFISYSSKQKSIADGVCHYLEENGFKCWMAPRDIPAGSEYGDLIEEAIKTSKVIVLVFSEAASISKWVKGEINVAFTENKTIFPFRVDSTPVEGGFRVMLNQMHWIDAFPHYADRLPDLLSSICGLIGRQQRKVIVQDSHEYVDLGLPSGTLWATCNVGAVKPEDYGNYFAWGETQPKADYSWTSYKYSNAKTRLCFYIELLTKYCSKPRSGYERYADRLTVLQTGDDAATANWGNSWNIPTKEQWKELTQNTGNTWTTRNGVDGRLFAASNGNSLFLPAAGCYCDEELKYVGIQGFYWSSSLNTNRIHNAWCFCFVSGAYRMLDNTYRSGGRSVRPVRSVK